MRIESIYRNIRFFKSLKSSLQFAISGWSESRYVYQLEEAIKSGNFFSNRVSSSTIYESAPYPIIVSSASGLSILKGNKVFNLLTTTPGFYVFGIASSQERIFVSINFHLPIKSNINNLIKKRITLLVSAKISDISESVFDKRHTIDWYTNFIDQKKSYSFLNYFNNSLYAADYLGNIDVFDVNENNSQILSKKYSYNLLKNNLHYPNYFYPYLHMNCVSIDEKNIYCGLHAYSKITNFRSSLYKIDKETNAISLEKDTDFVSAHDLMKVKNEFYGCDSDNGRLFKNDSCIFKSQKKSFFRGLSISKDGFVLGSSLYSKRRRSREKPNPKNKILFLDNNGLLFKTITPNLASIYRIFALGKYELTQSTPVNIMQEI